MILECKRSIPVVLHEVVTLPVHHVQVEAQPEFLVCWRVNAGATDGCSLSGEWSVRLCLKNYRSRCVRYASIDFTAADWHVFRIQPSALLSRTLHGVCWCFSPAKRRHRRVLLARLSTSRRPKGFPTPPGVSSRMRRRRGFVSTPRETKSRGMA